MTIDTIREQIESMKQGGKTLDEAIEFVTSSTEEVDIIEATRLVYDTFNQQRQDTPLSVGKNNNLLINIGGDAENSLKTGRGRDNFGITSAKWGDYSRQFDEVVKEAGKIARRDLAETIGLKPTSDTFRKLLSRRIDEKKVRPYRGSPSIIEWINREYIVTSLVSDQLETFLPIKLPLGISELVNIPPGSVIGVAGYTSAGKTSFLLETAELNSLSQPMPVYYWYHEMSEAKYRIRREDFPKLIEAQRENKFYPVKQSDFEFADVLEPDAINLIDYLDRDIDLFLIGQDIKQLQARLNTGIVIYALQKVQGRDFGYGGIPSAKLSNLYLALDVKKDTETTMYGRCKIVKAKDWVQSNPVGLYCDYHTGGKHGKLFLDGKWQRMQNE